MSPSAGKSTGVMFWFAVGSPVSALRPHGATVEHIMSKNSENLKNLVFPGCLCVFITASTYYKAVRFARVFGLSDQMENSVLCVLEICYFILRPSGLLRD